MAMSDKLGVFRGDPILTVDRVDSSQQYLDPCPLCGETHRHGRPQDGVTVNQLSHKVSHCADTGGYYIVITAETEVIADG